MILAIVIGILTAIAVAAVSFFTIWNNARDRFDFLKVFALIACIATVACSTLLYYAFYRHVSFYYEIWNSKITCVTYYEEWTEEHTTTSTDNEGNTTTHTSYEYHPEYWTCTDEYENETEIDQNDYHNWKNQWGNEEEIDIFRMSQSSWGDGDKYVSRWTGKFEQLFPWSFKKGYQNKIRATNTVWNFTEVDDELKDKFPRPADTGNLDPILSYGIPVSYGNQLLLKRWNAVWGPKYEIHNIVVLFDANKYPDRSIVETLINAWKGPNKNELVTCIGIKDNTIVWADVFSWMDDTAIHSLIRQDIVSNPKYKFDNVMETLKKYIPSNWKRKEFVDFSYLSVSLPWWSYLIIFMVDLLACAGSVMFIEHKVR